MTSEAPTPTLEGKRLACSREGCTVGTEGLCLEDIEPIQECPSLIILPDEDDDPSEEPTSPTRPAPARGVKLARGEALDLAEAGTAVGEVAMGLVTTIGDFRAGKTTLLATLFQMFSKGPFAGCTFAGTRTARGFDLRCFDSTTRSNNKRPDTKRTARGLHFLHLAMVERDSCRRFDILLSDRAGEEYEEIRDSDEHVADLVEVERSDVILLLVDGKKLSNPATRGVERHNAAVTVGALSQGGMLRQNALILVLLTKIDAIPAGGPEASAAIDAFDGIVSRMRADHGERLRIESFQIAARAQDGSLELGHGVETVLARIIVELSRNVGAAASMREPDPRTLTPYDLFSLSDRDLEP